MPCPQTNYMDELFDDLACLCEIWMNNRNNGRTPYAIRNAIMSVIEDIEISDEAIRATKCNMEILSCKQR